MFNTTDKNKREWVLALSFVILFALSISANASYLSQGYQAYENWNYSTAANLYKKACDGGNAKGCDDLGGLYELGKGVGQSYFTVAKLYKKACDDGDAVYSADIGHLFRF